MDSTNTEKQSAKISIIACNVAKYSYLLLLLFNGWFSQMNLGQLVPPAVILLHLFEKRISGTLVLWIRCPFLPHNHQYQTVEGNKSTNYKKLQSEYKHSLTFCARQCTRLQCIRLQAYVRVLSQQRNLCTNCKSAQYGTTRGHPSYIRVRAVVWECRKGQTDRQRDT